MTNMLNMTRRHNFKMTANGHKRPPAAFVRRLSCVVSPSACDVIVRATHITFVLFKIYGRCR